ncbi:MAG: hypothetical protein E7182_06235 [Erysipelotrichaceae bacterium]|nr:hypothetical protein [Erysipelotrichaceae bacterium]
MKISTVSSLTVSVKQLGFVADADFSTAAPSFQRENVDMGLVSSTDGKEFVAPAELKTTNSYAAGDMAHVTTKTEWTTANNKNKYVGYVKYLVRVQSPADTVGSNMNLRWKITMSDVDSALTNLWRVAFFEATSTAFGTNIGLYSNTSGSKAGFTWSNTAAVAGNYTTTALPASETLLAKNTTTYVNTTEGIDQYYGVSIWIDGNATGADNALGGKTLSSLLTFDLVAGDKTIPTTPTPAP